MQESRERRRKSRMSSSSLLLLSVSRLGLSLAFSQFSAVARLVAYEMMSHLPSRSGQTQCAPSSICIAINATVLPFCVAPLDLCLSMSSPYRALPSYFCLDRLCHWLRSPSVVTLPSTLLAILSDAPLLQVTRANVPPLLLVLWHRYQPYQHSLAWVAPVGEKEQESI